ncbi:MAG: NUDIX hydrolase [Lachnospiraceae bacterium]|nr:NUDIX hydrolase [Lachnospiraceae bacterium]
MKDENLTWQHISTETLLHDRWLDFRKSEYRFPDGKTAGPFYTFSRKDYAVIVATDAEGNYILVRQYRQGIRKVTDEFPAGGIESGIDREYRLDFYTENGLPLPEDDPDDIGFSKTSTAQPFFAKPEENALAGAKRELLEETGYKSDDWEFLTKIPSAATIADNWAYIFRAKNCVRVSAQDLDSIEFLNVRLAAPCEVKRMIAEGNFLQAMHVAAYYLAKENDNGTFR